MSVSADDRIRETQRLLGQTAMQISGIDSLFERLFVQMTGLPHDMGATVFLSHESAKADAIFSTQWPSSV
jgi:hypothetical protein